MQAEDRLLAPELAPSEAAAVPLEAMLREHDEIRSQLEAVEECLEADAQEAGEIGAYCAILSGTLAKHEHREESNLFPLWRGQLARLPAARQQELMARVEVVLRGERGEAIGEGGT
jgi:hemerythrin-like domain-containing protein